MLRRLLGEARTVRSRAIALRLRIRPGVEIGRGCRFHGTPIVSKADGTARIALGEQVVLTSVSRRTPLGVNHPVVLRALLPGAQISIGPGTGISGGSICAARSVSIGRGCLLGANVTVTDTDFHPVDARGRATLPIPDPQDLHSVVIGDDVFIGTGATILKGTRIGDGAVVGAGAVVSGTVEPGQIVAGNPARPIRAVRLP
jgi:acetyltransferase-like isoleucine patch superfamily enzyme